jgi:hypothetical protein
MRENSVFFFVVVLDEPEATAGVLAAVIVNMRFANLSAALTLSALVTSANAAAISARTANVSPRFGPHCPGISNRDVNGPEGCFGIQLCD